MRRLAPILFVVLLVALLIAHYELADRRSTSPAKPGGMPAQLVKPQGQVATMGLLNGIEAAPIDEDREPPDPRVVDVRVGEHPTFTRVVFELDRAASYQVDGNCENGALRVTLDAAAKATAIRWGGRRVRSISVEEGMGSAEACIALRGNDLRIEQTVLAEPSRIVLDVLNARGEAASHDKLTSPKLASHCEAEVAPPESGGLVPSAELIQVRGTVWHPVAQRRTALLVVLGSERGVKVREGESVAGFEVTRIEPSGVMLESGLTSVWRPIGGG